MKDSIVMIIIIFAYVFYFSFLGYFMFNGQLEGTSSFANFSDSFFYMLVLLTTANDPDIMLPAYYWNTWYCLFFILYLGFGLLFIFNILLAVIYNNYKNIIHSSITSKEDERRDYF